MWSLEQCSKVQEQAVYVKQKKLRKYKSFSCVLSNVLQVTEDACRPKSEVLKIL
jgi:hypothetical protein